jgi:hypothetical protein
VVGALSSLEDLDDLLEVLVLQSLHESSEVLVTVGPVLDLVEGGEVVTALLTFLVGHQLLDLACPVDHDGFKTLNLVLFTGSCLNIV